METTILKLPGQPLPVSTVHSPVIVTIWFTAFIALFFIIRSKLKEVTTPVADDYSLVKWGTFTLILWYCFAVADRWLHWATASVPYGYIIVIVVWEFFRIGSALMLHWATYQIVWTELERRFPRSTRGMWWLAAKASLFVVGLVSLFYLVLNLVVAAIWLQFLSLNIIGDVATKRNQFELAMACFFFIFGLLTLAAAVATVIQTRKKDGVGLRENQTQLYLLLATILLFIRATIELALTARVFGPSTRRTDIILTRDVSAGLLTVLYLIAMVLTAHFSAEPSNPGAQAVNTVKSNVRDLIIDRLDQATHKARNESPSFLTILTQIENELPTLLTEENLRANSTQTPEEDRRTVQRYLQKLRTEGSELRPREGMDFRARSNGNALIGHSPGSRLSGRGRSPALSSPSSFASLKARFRRSSAESPPTAPADPSQLPGGYRNVSDPLSIRSSPWDRQMDPIPESHPPQPPSPTIPRAPSPSVRFAYNSPYSPVGSAAGQSRPEFQSMSGHNAYQQQQPRNDYQQQQQPRNDYMYQPQSNDWSPSETVSRYGSQSASWSNNATATATAPAPAPAAAPAPAPAPAPQQWSAPPVPAPAAAPAQLVQGYELRDITPQRHSPEIARPYREEYPGNYGQPAQVYQPQATHQYPPAASQQSTLAALAAARGAQRQSPLPSLSTPSMGQQLRSRPPQGRSTPVNTYGRGPAS